MHYLGYELPRIRIPRTSVNSPSPYPDPGATLNALRCSQKFRLLLSLCYGQGATHPTSPTVPVSTHTSPPRRSHALQSPSSILIASWTQTCSREKNSVSQTHGSGQTPHAVIGQGATHPTSPGVLLATHTSPLRQALQRGSNLIASPPQA